MKPYFSKRNRRIRRFFRWLHPEGTLQDTRIISIPPLEQRLLAYEPKRVQAWNNEDDPYMPIKTIRIPVEKYRFGNWVLKAGFNLRINTLAVAYIYNLHDHMKPWES
jgi:hypothetical protein